MAKLITLSFAVVGLAVGFLVGILVASELKPNEVADSMTLVLIVVGAIATAVLFRWAAAAARDTLNRKYWPALGSGGAVLALASLSYLFSSIK